jgi:hypothetical protein
VSGWIGANRADVASDEVEFAVGPRTARARAWTVPIMGSSVWDAERMRAVATEWDAALRALLPP